MHFFDIVILIFITVFVALGIKRGLVSEIFRLAAVAGGFLAAFLFYRQMYNAISFITMPSAAKTALSFLLVYAAAALSILAAGWVVKKIVHLTMLGWADRILGGAAGCIKAMVIIWILMLCLALVPRTAIHDILSPSSTFKLFTSIPLRLRPGQPIRPLPFLNTSIDIDKPLGKIREARERLDGFKEKVDSASAVAESLKDHARPTKDK